MLDNLSPGFSAEYLIRAGEDCDFHDRDRRSLFASISMYSFMQKIEEELPDSIDECMAVWYQACAENTIFVGEKDDVLTTFIFGLDSCLFLSYDINRRSTTWEASDDYQPIGKMTVFSMGQFKENGLIRRFVHVDPEHCASLYNQLKDQINQENADSSRVFSFENWKLVYGNYPFNQSLLDELEDCDGEEIMRVGNSITGNPQYMLKSMMPMTTFGLIATRDEDDEDLTSDDFAENPDLTNQLLSAQIDLILPIPFMFHTPALLVSKGAIAFAMVSPSEEKQGFYTIQSDAQYPVPEMMPNLFDEFNEDRRFFANGLVDSDESIQVYLLNMEQLQRYTDAVIAPRRRKSHVLVDISNAKKYFGFLNGCSDQDELSRVKKLYEQQCLLTLLAVGNEKNALEQEAIEARQEAERQRRAEEERHRQEVERRRREEERRIEENRRREEALRLQREAEERRKREEEQRRLQQQALSLTNTFHTKIAGVTYSNSGANTESRQRIIHDLVRLGKLNRGQELRLVKEPTNPYDNHAVAVFGPDGRQLGYLAKEIARTVFDGMSRGNVYKIFVSDVTGGGAGMAYGVNVRVETYTSQPTYTAPTRSTYQPSRSYGYSSDIDYSDFEDINSIARSEGFSIDDDGHWVPFRDNDY